MLPVQSSRACSALPQFTLINAWHSERKSIGLQRWKGPYRRKDLPDHSIEPLTQRVRAALKDNSWQPPAEERVLSTNRGLVLMQA